MLGISTYFKDLDYDYLKKAADIGAEYLFTSLHIPEEDLSNLSEELPIFLKNIKEYGLQLVPDVSPRTFEKLGLENNDYEGLKSLGFKTIRLDYGFDDFEMVIDLQKHFKLILNASTVNGQYLDEAQEAGVNLDEIALMHNFYPKTDTGLSFEYFAQLNQEFVERNLEIMAFVPGDKLKRFPLYEGLPTVEKHRQQDPYVSAVELMHDYQISDILIGDSEAYFETLEWIQAYMDDKTMHIPVSLKDDYKHLFDKSHAVRRDLSDTVIRVASERVAGIDIEDNSYRVKGAITMENKLSGRYSGEIQITKDEKPANSGTNVIGFVDPNYVQLLHFVDKDTKIKFVRI